MNDEQVCFQTSVNLSDQVIEISLISFQNSLFFIITDCNRIGSILTKSSKEEYDEEIEMETVFGFNQNSEQ